ncbi:MAG: PAS domain-containing protein [Acidobacteria bacterium]|nr:PAS domain-containing protein [Acidobacteriota bacterium]
MAVGAALVTEDRVWLLAVEAALVISLLVGLALVRRVFATFTLLRESTQLLAESDFTTRIRPTGLDETDSLVSVYNRMADSLREERTKQEEKHHFLARILSASPSGILTLDFDGRVDFANPAAEKLLGAGAKELLALKLDETASPLARALAELPENATDLLSAGEGRRLRVHRGTFYDRGFPRAFYLVEELTEELRRYEKSAYERVIRMMSHEVNNSVGAARSLLASAAHYEKHLPEPDRADLAQALSVASGRLGQLNTFMRGFAEVVRLPAPNLAPVAVAPLLQGLATLMAASPAAAGHAIRVEVEQDLPPVRADHAQLEQALVNIAKNGLEAMDTGPGTLTLRAFLDADSRIAIEVEDTGLGLSSEAVKQLFTPFYTSKENGQGLGLTLVREILVSNGARFSLDGPPGGPTRFRISLSAWERRA